MQKVQRAQKNIQCPSTPNEDFVPPNDGRRTRSPQSFEEGSPDSLYYSPNVIRPLPPPCPKKTNRKRKLGKAEILTSTPIRMEQLEKLNNSKTTVKKLPLEMTKKAAKDKLRPKKQSKKQVVDKQKEKTYHCEVCGEPYVEIKGKPAETWIMCNKCQNWSHEACTAYEGQGNYICDGCK